MEIVSIQGDVSNVDRIDVTDEQGTYDIVSHLILNGHKRIGFIGYQYETRILKSRLDGYKRALAEHSIEMNEQYIGDGEHSYQSGYNMTMDLLSLPTPPTAIHCFNEYMAYAAFDAIRDRGLRVPEDVSLTGFDNLFISRVLEPRLTTIDTHVDMMAKLAMDMLLDRIEERISGEPQHLYISHKLIKRGSVASI